METPTGTCEVVGCQRSQRRHGMCVPHAMTWLCAAASNPGADREERRRAFIARRSLSAAARHEGMR